MILLHINIKWYVSLPKVSGIIRPFIIHLTWSDWGRSSDVNGSNYGETKPSSVTRQFNYPHCVRNLVIFDQTPQGYQYPSLPTRPISLFATIWPPKMKIKLKELRLRRAQFFFAETLATMKWCKLWLLWQSNFLIGNRNFWFLQNNCWSLSIALWRMGLSDKANIHHVKFKSIHH